MGSGFLRIQVNHCHLRPWAQSWNRGSLRPGAIFHTPILRGSEGPFPSHLASGLLDYFISVVISPIPKAPPPSHARELSLGAALTGAWGYR